MSDQMDCSECGSDMVMREIDINCAPPETYWVCPECGWECNQYGDELEAYLQFATRIAALNSGYYPEDF